MDLAKLIAQVPKDIGGPIEGIGPYGKGLGSAGEANTQFATILSSIVGALTIGGGIWFVFNIMMGAITWIGAAGDKTQLQMAQKRITSAVTGLVIMIAAMVIIAVVGSMFGFNILGFDIKDLVP